MKREIVCPEHAAFWRGTIELAKAEGERVTVVDGKARFSMRCDFCNVPIECGNDCSAVGVVGPMQFGKPGWEAEFVEVSQ